ncbi:DUF3293 domain-containing protein [Nitrosovibrio sp. Nv4]|uniref:DUF3293 domain-containing protein n=1 Tax=Nitrosovibrio sp. Nv4 TaxID=1945880 RepID=UPI000BC375E4|nr:DUF3293 domain-containing protein [Nitrosovibrio sp. Nv4]SOD41649.1 Protein of unknown function [Nitrosovibrio sp. Nv4]
MPQSEISEDLIAAYRSTNYRAGTGEDGITLRVGEYSEPLSRLFAQSGHRCAAFITACNPFGALENREANMKACADLRDRLDRYVARPDQIIEGMGIGSSGAWPPEKSFLVLGLDLETSRTLGREFGQNAVVWVGADAIPQLILLR